MSKKPSKKPKGMPTHSSGDDMPPPNPYLKQHILEAVDNQIRDNTPPSTRETLERLQADGYTEKQAKEKIAAVLVEDIYEIMKNKTPFNEHEYAKRLNALK